MTKENTNQNRVEYMYHRLMRDYKTALTVDLSFTYAFLSLALQAAQGDMQYIFTDGTNEAVSRMAVTGLMFFLAHAEFTGVEVEPARMMRRDDAPHGLYDKFMNHVAQPHIWLRHDSDERSSW